MSTTAKAEEQKKITVRVPAAQWDEMRIKAVQRKVSVEELAREAFAMLLKKYAK
jgi:predicted HicB family RNase H-like nuclease